MAQLQETHYEEAIARSATVLDDLDLDFARARRQVKRAIKECQEANRILADLEDRLDTLGGRLARIGISLEVGDE